jgi:hypothetical protein
MVIACIRKFRADYQKSHFFGPPIFEVFHDFPIVVSKKYFFFLEIFFVWYEELRQKKNLRFLKKSEKSQI